MSINIKDFPNLKAEPDITGKISGELKKLRPDDKTVVQQDIARRELGPYIRPLPNVRIVIQSTKEQGNGSISEKNPDPKGEIDPGSKYRFPV